jgi:hypothetical protein
MEFDDKYESSYSKMLEIFHEGYRDRNGTVALFWPVVGKNYQKSKILFVGRAGNSSWGWNEVDVSELSSESIEDAKNGIKNWMKEWNIVDNCPMSWLYHNREIWLRPDTRDRGYNWTQSRFWQVICGVLRARWNLDNDSPWWSYCAWTNLYKIAPAEGGNPSARMIRAQREQCLELLKQELSVLCPTNVVIVTGIGWAEPFLQNLQYNYTKLNGYVEAKGVSNYGAPNVLITCRPEGKPEDRFVREVCEQLR